ncbi:hypothetical protein GH793_16095, partial [Listeria monocytogenes]|nr:hypothetical protein [Listeria monocytogenes]
KKCVLRRRNLARYMRHIKDFRRPEFIQQLAYDLELAEVTVKAYASHFDFVTMFIDSAFRLFLQVLWPEDELELQHLLIKYFTIWYLKCNERPLRLQNALYNLCCAMIL